MKPTKTETPIELIEFENDIPQPTTHLPIHGFDWAIRMLKRGHRVAREGWNGKGMFLLLAGGYEVGKENLQARKHISAAFLEAEGVETLKIDPHIDMWTAQNTYLTGWLASQSDMLSEDWYEVK